MRTSLRTARVGADECATARGGVASRMLALACLLLSVAPLHAQLTPALESRPMASMGQPPRWLPYASGSGVFGDGGTDPGARLLAGIHRPVWSAIIGFGIDGEVYGTAGGDDLTGGVRLLGAARALNLSAGLDWDAGAQNTVFALSWTAALRRGGFAGGGTMLRVDWLPARPRPIAVGVSVPFGQAHAGRTRPRPTGVSPPEPAGADRARARREAQATLPAATESALAAVREAAVLISLYTSFFSEQSGSGLLDTRRGFRSLVERARDSLAVISARYPRGRGYEDAVRVYDTELARAFESAVDGTADARAPSVADEPMAVTGAGALIAARARAGLLDHVILPYDTLFGRVKNREHELGGLTAAAQANFARWLEDSSAVAAARRPAALAVHARWLAIVDEVHESLVDRWDDSRRIWLPVQLALAPEEYDEQAEVDALLGRAVGRPFSERNDVTLLASTDLPLEFARSVLAARDYHVLWVHDFPGTREGGVMDRVGYRMVADVYFPALVAAVHRYGDTGRMATYQLFLDAHYYALRDGELWMSILENPLGAPVALPPGNDAAAAHLRARQQELRAAVAASARLQADAARGGGERWLRETVKVHVSVTHPSDFSFRSHRIIPPIPFLPDNLMRDHRKLAFYDLTEADPYRGAMVLGGVGIGEHYFTPTWDDRGAVVRGPAAVEVRAAARRLLDRNGTAERDMPEVLREVEVRGGAAAAPPVDAGGPYDTRALQVHNETGFGGKQSSVARAMLYNVAPRGSIIIVPDPIWVSGEWAGMLAAAALRGCRVYVIAPSATNGPNPEGVVAAQMNDVLGRLLVIQEVLGPEIARAGGELRVGLYTATEDVNDMARLAREVRAGVERAPWLRELVPFDAAALAVLDSVAAHFERGGYAAVAPGRDLVPRAPKLHAKTQLVASPEALATIVRQPQVPEFLWRWFLVRARQTSADADPGGIAAAAGSLGLDEVGDAIARGYAAALSADARRRVSFYYQTGTQNQDPRGLMMDGETTLIVSGGAAARSIFDFYAFMARTTWITSDAELDEHLPPPNGFIQWLGRFARYVL